MVTILGRTIGIDEKTYKELVRLTAHFMQKTEEQISISDIVRLSVYLFKGCLDSYPELGNQILNQIDFGDQKKSTKDNDFDEQKEPRDYLSKDITPEWRRRLEETLFGER